MSLLTLLALNFLLGLIGAEYIIQVMFRREKPDHVDEEDFASITEGLDVRSNRNVLRVLFMLFGVLTFIITAAIELSYQLNHKKGSL